MPLLVSQSYTGWFTLPQLRLLADNVAALGSDLKLLIYTDIDTRRLPAFRRINFQAYRLFERRDIVIQLNQFS